MKTTSFFTTLVGAAVVALPVLSFGQMTQEKKPAPPAKQVQAASSEQKKAPAAQPNAHAKAQASSTTAPASAEGKTVAKGTAKGHEHSMKHEARSKSASMTNTPPKAHEQSATSSKKQEEQKPATKVSSPSKHY